MKISRYMMRVTGRDGFEYTIPEAFLDAFNNCHDDDFDIFFNAYAVVEKVRK